MCICADVRNKLVAVGNPKRRLTDASCVWSHQSQNVATMHNTHAPSRSVGFYRKVTLQDTQGPEGKANNTNMNLSGNRRLSTALN